LLTFSPFARIISIIILQFLIILMQLFGTSLTANVKVTGRTISASATATLAAKAATPRVLAPANPPTANDVQNSITNWAISVNTVNDYLNNPNNNTKLQSAIVFAKMS
jgi:hypothetical protein